MIYGLWKTGKIPNMLTAVAILAGCGYFATAGMGLEAGKAAVRSFAVLLCLFPLHLFRMTGAGDVKMMVCMAFFLDMGEWIQVIAAAAVLAGFWSVHVMWRKGIAEKRMRYLLCYIQRFLQTGERKAYITEETDSDALLCLGPFVWAGMTLFLMREGAG